MPYKALRFDSKGFFRFYEQLVVFKILEAYIRPFCVRSKISPARGSCGERSEPQGILMPFCFPLRASPLRLRASAAPRAHIFCSFPESFFSFFYMSIIPLVYTFL